MRIRRTVGAVAIVGVLAVTACGGEASEVSENYPEEPIEYIVPYATGGGNDLVARTMANHIGNHLEGASFNVVNNPGASGAIGAGELAQAEPNGYTLGNLSTSVVAVNPARGDVNYSADDFTIIAKVAVARQLLLVPDDSDLTGFEDWLSLVQEDPGEFTYATAGVGGTQHLAMARLEQLADIDVQHVPYDSIGEAKTALRGGHVDSVLAPIYSADRGEMKPLFSFDAQEGETTQDVPLLTDLGYDININVSHYVAAPADLPDEYRDVLETGLQSMLEDEEYIEEFSRTELDREFVPGDEAEEEISAKHDEFESILEDVDLAE